METSILLGKIIGPIMVVLGAGVLMNRRYYEKTFEDFVANRAFIFVIGLLALVIGSLIVRFHNVWTADWRVIITLIGWLSVFRGLLATLAPQAFMSFGMKFIENRTFITFALIGNILLGAVLTYAAYAN